MSHNTEKAVKEAVAAVMSLVNRGLLPRSEAQARILVESRVRAKAKRKGWTERKMLKKIRNRLWLRRAAAKIPSALKFTLAASGKDSKLVNLVNHYTKDL